MNGLYHYLEERSLGRQLADKAKGKRSPTRKGSVDSVWGARNNPDKTSRPSKPRRVNTPNQQARRQKALGKDVANQTRNWKPADVSVTHSSGKAAVQKKANRLAALRKSDPVAAGVARAPTVVKAPTLSQKLTGAKDRAKLALNTRPKLKTGLKVAAGTAAVVGAGLLAKKILAKRRAAKKAKLADSHDVGYSLQEAADQIANLRMRRTRNLYA